VGETTQIEVEETLINRKNVYLCKREINTKKYYDYEKRIENCSYLVGSGCYAVGL
jgi:hypothetical protein